jgi:hypothetical protein
LQVARAAQVILGAVEVVILQELQNKQEEQVAVVGVLQAVGHLQDPGARQ